MEDKNIHEILIKERQYHKANLELFGREMKKKVDNLQNNLELKNEKVMDLGKKLRMTQEKLKTRVKELEESYARYQEQSIMLKKTRELLELKK